jgi:peptidoglycan-N-acetylmuramic acid deacetylase
MRKREVLIFSFMLIITLVTGCGNSENKTVLSPKETDISKQPLKTLEPVTSINPSPAPSDKPTLTPSPSPLPSNEPLPAPSPTARVEATSTPKPTVKPVPSITPRPTPLQLKSYTYGRYTLTDNNLSNSSIGWYFGRSTTFQRLPGAKSESWLKQYGAYYLGENRKVIYLTFDEGQSPTYAGKNLDTLKKHGVKAVFFVTKPFMKEYPDLIKRMVSEGHIVGNHTDKHQEMPTLAGGDKIENFIKEIADTENAFKALTGKNMEKIFRYPKGVFSEKTLSFTKALGYKSYFWSFAYNDWEENAHTRESSLEWMKKYYHPGAIYLLHGVSKGNSEALDEFITFMKEKEYVFDVVTNIK